MNLFPSCNLNPLILFWGGDNKNMLLIKEHTVPCVGAQHCVSVQAGRYSQQYLSCTCTFICFSFFASFSQLLGNYFSASCVFSLDSLTGICFLGTLCEVTRFSWLTKPHSRTTFKQVWKRCQTTSLLIWKQLSANTKCHQCFLPLAARREVGIPFSLEAWPGFTVPSLPLLLLCADLGCRNIISSRF